MCTYIHVCTHLQTNVDWHNLTRLLGLSPFHSEWRLSLFRWELGGWPSFLPHFSYNSALACILEQAVAHIHSSLPTQTVLVLDSWPTGMFKTESAYACVWGQCEYPLFTNFFHCCDQISSKKPQKGRKVCFGPGIKGRQACGGSSGLWQQEAACLHLSRSRSRDETESGTENLKAGRWPTSSSQAPPPKDSTTAKTAPQAGNKCSTHELLEGCISHPNHSALLQASWLWCPADQEGESEEGVIRCTVFLKVSPSPGFQKEISFRKRVLSVIKWSHWGEA